VKDESHVVGLGRYDGYGLDRRAVARKAEATAILL
jgi:hypothetical protein